MIVRLTALFSGATLLILLIVSLLLHWRLAATLRAEDETILRENLAALRSAWLRSPLPLATLQQQIALEELGPRQEPYYLRYLRDERVVLETPGMASVVAPARFPGPGRASPGEPTRWVDASGRAFLLHALPIDDAGEHVFQAALDVTHDDELLRSYRIDLLAAVFTGTILAALAGAVTARRGLRPLGRMTESMHQITAGRLDQRIGRREWPRELAELAEVFDEMLGRLEDSFERLSRFSADLAHELRTPLTNLRGEAEVALRHSRSESEYRAVLESSLEEFVRLTTLVDRLLFLARAEGGATVLEPHRLDARAEIEAVRDFYAAVAEDRGIQMTCTGMGSVSADQVLLRRAVANLLANAVEHTPRGGRVCLDVAEVDDALVVTVADTGRGIPPEHLPHVMNRFYQVPDGRPRSEPGSGLGLALVRSIMSLHGGTARIESTPGVGTRATLIFPKHA